MFFPNNKWIYQQKRFLNVENCFKTYFADIILKVTQSFVIIFFYRIHFLVIQTSDNQPFETTIPRSKIFFNVPTLKIKIVYMKNL